MADPLAGHPRYRTIREVGAGTFGRVYLAEDAERRRHVAVKVLRRGCGGGGGERGLGDEGMAALLLRELETHRTLCHPHVVGLREVLLTRTHLGIVLEYADGGSLARFLSAARGPLPENQARWLLQQIVCAIDYLHRMGIVNRDIKPENTLLAGNAAAGSEWPLVKLCDFGFAKSEAFHSAPNTLVGSPAYIAPEVIRSAEDNTPYDGKAADVWSLGVMLYRMATGALPFQPPAQPDLTPHAQLRAMRSAICAARYTLPRDGGLSRECEDLLRRMLVADPAQRISIPQIQKHAFYLKYLPPGAHNMAGEQKVAQQGQGMQELAAMVREAQHVGT